MARGRILNNKISRDKAVARLDEEVGPYGVIIFTWMIAHLDCEGRLSGDPYVVKGLVAPRLHRCTAEIVEQTLAVANSLELIRWYKADGDMWIEFPNFAKNQPNLRKDREAESACPEPPLIDDVPGKDESISVVAPTPDLIRSNSGVTPDLLPPKRREVKRREVKRREVKVIVPTSRGELSGVCLTPGITQVFDAYRKHHPRSHPRPNAKGKEWRAIKARLAEGYSTEDLCLAVEGCHLSPYHSGENEQGTKYQALELIVRDGGKVTKFRELAEQHAQGPPVVLTAKEAKTVRASNSWVARHEEKERENAER